MEIGWIGVGRMGFPMVSRLLAAGYAVKVWNRTRSKAEPLAAEGATVVDDLAALAGVDVLFTMLSSGKDVIDICFGASGLFAPGAARAPKLLVDCSTIGVEELEGLRSRLERQGIAYLAAPVSGNGKCVRAGKLSSVVSGPRDAFDRVEPLIAAYAPMGAYYVGEGELARVCKIAHNLMLAVVAENLVEMTLLAQKAGIARHDFLRFINGSVMGSIFSRYKSPALVNLDWTTTFTPAGLRKDIDLGLALGRSLGVPLPVVAATREVLQGHFGAASLKPDPAAYLEKDFAALLETMALLAGMGLESEGVAVPTGLED